MRVVRKVIDAILWIRPIHRWTTVFTIAFFGGALLWLIAVAAGLTDVASSPNEVVIRLYEAAQESRADDLRETLSSAAKTEFDRLSPADAQALMDRLSNDHLAGNYESLGIRNYGTHAVVGITMDSPAQYSHLRVEVLVREGGRWRVEWPVGEAQWAEANRRFDPNYRSGSVESN
jgi:hypothetical protein